jgi:alkylresorcinol/alkylpyrone synthase
VAELSGLGPVERALLERLHGNAGVDYRHTVLPLPECGGLRGIGLANDRHIGEAADLGERALRGALEAAGLAGRDLDQLIVTSVTGVAVPSLDARLIPRLGLGPDVKRLPIFGLGSSPARSPWAGCTITRWPGPIITRRCWRSSSAR